MVRRNYLEPTIADLEKKNNKTVEEITGKDPPFFSVVYFPPSPPPHLKRQSGLPPLFSLTLSYLCVAGRACLFQLTGDGGGEGGGGAK